MVKQHLCYYWNSSGKVLQSGREWGKPLDFYLKAFPQMELSENYVKSLNNFRNTNILWTKNIIFLHKTSEFSLLTKTGVYNATWKCYIKLYLSLLNCMGLFPYGIWEALYFSMISTNLLAVMEQDDKLIMALTFSLQAIDVSFCFALIFLCDFGKSSFLIFTNIFLLFTI